MDPELACLAHCFVAVDEGARIPALVMEWRNDGAEARVVRPWLDFEDGKWVPREEWLAAEDVEVVKPFASGPLR